MLIAVPYVRVVRFPTTEETYVAYRKLVTLIATLPHGSYTLLPHQPYHLGLELALVGDAPSPALQTALRAIFAPGLVRGVPARRKEALVVEHGKTLRDNGWLPVATDAPVTLARIAPVPTCRVSA